MHGEATHLAGSAYIFLILLPHFAIASYMVTTHTVPEIPCSTKVILTTNRWTTRLIFVIASLVYRQPAVTTLV